jgi:sugar lactone lactonase YvrE
LTALTLLCVGEPQAWRAGVANAATTGTFGKTTVGALSDRGMLANYKIVHRSTLAVPGSVTKLTVFAIPGTGSPSPQALRAVIYADSGGSPGALLAKGKEVTYQGNVNGSGWFDLPFSSPVTLSPGTYWLGFITGITTQGMGYVYDSVANSRAYNPNSYASGPSDPFGSATVDSQQASIYASYTPAVPVAVTLPTISGTAALGYKLTASPGTWSYEPTSYTYRWKRCSSAGTSCTAITGATASTYTLRVSDVGSLLRVAVTASNPAGRSKPASSTATKVVTASTSVQHLEYAFVDGLTSVYDADHGQKLLQTISLPQTKAGIRGVMAAPSTHLLFISYGGDGGGVGNGSVLAYNLITEKVVWIVHLATGIDSGAVSPDGKRLYMPTGESTASGIWNILDTKDGAAIGTIQGGAGAHNTIASNDGRYVYLGGRNYNYLDVYETATGAVRKVGAMIGGVRPFTVNGSNTLAFTTATGFDGFQVSSIATGKVLFTTSFGAVPKEFAFSAPSHGVSLSPDEKQLYVIDAVNKEVRVYDVSRVSEGVAPSQLGVIPVAGLTGTETTCAYDCGRDGWLQHSLDGRFVYVGDSGEVIETATRKVLTTLPALLNTRKSLEIDWSGGAPIATSGRTGVGYSG